MPPPIKHILLSAILISTLSCKQLNDMPIRIISFNIRYDNPADGVNAWPNRIDNVAGLIRFHSADIVCLQEALNHQLADLQQRLPNMKWVGVARDDGQTKGEYAAIMYNFSRFKLLETNNFWLSTTPQFPSLGWDAACIRICTYAKFRDLITKSDFFVFNTHFDHVGQEAQINSAKLIIDSISMINLRFPVILSGDFNVEPNSEAISMIKNSLNDSWNIPLEPPYGPIGTWNSFNFNSLLDKRIDYIFVNKYFQVQKVAHLTDSKEQRYPSDHLPVFTQVRFLH